MSNNLPKQCSLSEAGSEVQMCHIHSINIYQVPTTGKAQGLTLDTAGINYEGNGNNTAKGLGGGKNQDVLKESRKASMARKQGARGRDTS